MSALALSTAPSAPKRPFRLIRHSLVLAKRNLIGVMRNPEALLDVTLQPIIFIALFTYNLRRRDRQRLPARTTCSSCCRASSPRRSPSVPWPSASTSTPISRRASSTASRSLPIARAAPLVGAVLGDVVRYGLLCIVTIGFGYVLGFRANTGPFEVLAACLLGIAFALCLSWVSVLIGMYARTPGSVQGIIF